MPVAKFYIQDRTVGDVQVEIAAGKKSGRLGGGMLFPSVN